MILHIRDNPSQFIVNAPHKKSYKLGDASQQKLILSLDVTFYESENLLEEKSQDPHTVSLDIYLNEVAHSLSSYDSPSDDSRQ